MTPFGTTFVNISPTSATDNIFPVLLMFFAVTAGCIVLLSFVVTRILRLFLK